jgi:hypothetical protein
MEQPSGAERWLARLLRLVGGVCALALVPLFLPRAWLAAAHEGLGWGAFPAAPVAEYLARSVCSLSAFYGGLLLVLSSDVRRYAPVVRYQALAIMALSASGAVVGTGAGMPLWFVGGDAAACWLYGAPMVLLARRVERGRTGPGHAAGGRGG